MGAQAYTGYKNNWLHQIDFRQPPNWPWVEKNIFSELPLPIINFHLAKWSGTSGLGWETTKLISSFYLELFFFSLKCFRTRFIVEKNNNKKTFNMITQCCLSSSVCMIVSVHCNYNETDFISINILFLYNGSKNTFTCEQHYIRATAVRNGCQWLLCFALLEDIAIKRELVLRDNLLCMLDCPTYIFNASCTNDKMLTWWRK